MTEDKILPGRGRDTQPREKGSGGRRPGAGKKPGTVSPENKKLRDSLERIIAMKAGSMPGVKTNGDILAERLWNYALVCSPSNPKGLNALIEIFDRIDGKAAPSKEELDSNKNAQKIIVCLPSLNANVSGL